MHACVSLSHVTKVMLISQQFDITTMSLPYVTLVTYVSEQSAMSIVSLLHVNVQLMSYDYSFVVVIIRQL